MFVKDSRLRCSWVNLNNPLYVTYHDKEWGKPVHDDLVHFEFITLEGAQAGLSWETVLKKREHYRKLFAGFDPVKVARFTAAKIEKLLLDPGIIRNRLKVESTVSNAKAFLKIQVEFGSFDQYIWNFVDHKTIDNKYCSTAEYPTSSPLSDIISKDLKRRGFRFIGTTIMYAYMQAVGLVNDHLLDCGARKFTNKSWYVYMLRCADRSLYTGISNDVSRRFLEHQSDSKRCAKYLRGKQPLTLVLQRSVTSKSAALKLELKIKSLSKLEKELLIQEQSTT